MRVFDRDARIGVTEPIEPCRPWDVFAVHDGFVAVAKNRTKLNIPVKLAMNIGTPQPGPVGGRIAAEVFLCMLFGDNDSFLNADTGWVPTIRNKGEKFALRDIVASALGK